MRRELKLGRNRSTFSEKISIKDPQTQKGYEISLNNLENYCMEKYGKSDYFKDLRRDSFITLEKLHDTCS